MDLLSQRYASPFFVLDEFIRLGQLHDFIQGIMKVMFEEKKEKYRWEFFLHKVFDNTYEEYLNFVEGTENEAHSMTDDEIIRVTAQSRDLLNNFVFE